MKKTVTLSIVATLTLSACASVPASNAVSESAAALPPPELVDLAAPNQDLSSARVLPEDGCFWYEHNGRVEVTLLPLLTRDGSQICVSTEA